MNKNKYVNNMDFGDEKEAYFYSTILNTRSITDYNTTLNKEYSSHNSIDFLFININKFSLVDIDPKLETKYKKFIKTLYNIFVLYGESITKLNSIPLFISQDESSIFIEWIFAEFRVGFTIEMDQSSCFIISTKRLKNYMKSVELEEGNPTPFLIEVMEYVLGNR